MWIEIKQLVELAGEQQEFKTLINLEKVSQIQLSQDFYTLEFKFMDGNVLTIEGKKEEITQIYKKILENLKGKYLSFKVSEIETEEDKPPF